ncbi:MAG: DUF3017 domain-containing protein [Streptomycetaceae bacterium]|nr:DUF3017 domain-containing protein [Streptomycetaceae bacterium]
MGAQTSQEAPDGGARVNGADPGLRKARSSRFPEITRDTARPEGGGRVVGGEHSAPARQWPLLTVLGGVGLGLAITAAGSFRTGLIVIGVFMLLGAVMRWLLPSVGMLAVRSRFTDLLTYGTVGGAIILLSLMVEPNPILHFPFLDSIVRYAVSRD